MNESLAKRMEELAVHLKEEYAREKQAALFAANVDYKNTADVADISTRVLPESGEVTVSQYRSAEAVGATALLIISTLFIINKIRQQDSGTLSVLFLLVWIFALLYYIIRSLNKSPRLVFNKANIWAWEPGKNIPWDHIAAAFIKTDDHGESTNRFLVIHYYEPEADEFEMIEVKLDGLNFSVEEIAGYFEFFLQQKNDIV